MAAASESSPAPPVAEDLEQALKRGELRIGMSTAQVLSLRGEPTRKEMIPPDAELWTYAAGDIAFIEGVVTYFASELITGERSAPIRPHIEHLMSLFEQFCRTAESHIVAREDLRRNRFRPLEEYEGIYEAPFDNVSYAVHPLEDSCTVDVLLEQENGKLLFSSSDVHEALLDSQYTFVEEEQLSVKGTDSETILTLQRTYRRIDSEGSVFLLDYPITHQDVRYMSLSESRSDRF